MNATEIIEVLRSRLTISAGRHLYGVLGSYPGLNAFAETLRQARLLDGQPFPEVLSVNRGILAELPDDEFRILVTNEAKRPEPTAAHVGEAFEKFLRRQLAGTGLVVLAHLEMLFAYNVELNLLRAMAADDDRILLLLPGKREGGRVIMYPAWESGSYTLPINLIAENHLWVLDT